jgi:phosphatidylserine decarboxylase
MTLRKNETEDVHFLTSPCDGTIFSISQIKDVNDLTIVKGCKYNIEEFLFGSNNMKEDLDLIQRLIKTKHVYQITIYLSPGDCHRFFSPGEICVKKRIYNPGYLEPVKPSYVKKNPNVFKTNERVTLQCKFEEPNQNLLYITYVGAMNVGSIRLNFDSKLKTNQKIVNYF